MSAISPSFEKARRDGKTVGMDVKLMPDGSWLFTLADSSTELFQYWPAFFRGKRPLAAGVFRCRNWRYAYELAKNYADCVRRQSSERDWRNDG